MGSFADIKINGFRIESTKNYFEEWYFKTTDRKILELEEFVPEQTDESEIWKDRRYVYAISAKRLVRRLELAGFNLRVAEREFKECVDARRLAAIDFSDCKDFDFDRDVSTLGQARFDEWLERLKLIVSQNLCRTFDFSDNVKHEDAVLDLLLNIPFYQFYSDDWALHCHDQVNWPAKTIESLARSVLAVVDPDAECYLDVTELVRGGYTDAFDDLIEHSASSTKTLEIFDTAIGDVRALMGIAPENETLARLLFANTITAMETYFGDTLRKQISRREVLLRRFVESSPELKEKKFPIAKVFEQRESILGQVMEILERTSFHDISRVKNIFCSVFAVQLSGLPWNLLEEAVKKRHDIVHRNGFDSSGNRFVIAMKDVDQLIVAVSEVLKGIDKQIQDGLLDDLEIEEGFIEGKPDSGSF